MDAYGYDGSGWRRDCHCSDGFDTGKLLMVAVTIASIIALANGII